MANADMSDLATEFFDDRYGSPYLLRRGPVGEGKLTLFPHVSGALRYDSLFFVGRLVEIARSVEERYFKGEHKLHHSTHSLWLARFSNRAVNRRTFVVRSHYPPPTKRNG